MTRLFLALTCAATGACALSGDAATGSAPFRTAIDTVGDTIVARTTGEVPDTYLHRFVEEWRIGGELNDTANSFGDVQEIAVGADGRVYVWDSQTPSMWLIDADGGAMRRFGVKGSGPGEYQNINGIAVLTDGRLVAWDGGNSRINVYRADGEFDTTWRLTESGTYITQRSVLADTHNRMWMSRSVRMGEGRDAPSRAAWFLFDSTGTLVDTVIAPDAPRDPSLTARRQDANVSSSTSRSVPYGLSPSFAVSPDGEVVWGPGSPYVVHASHEGRPLRIERDWTPVPITDAERNQWRASVEWSMRNVQANWTWTGPDVPTVKPPYASVATGADGSIWVQVHVPSEEYEPDPPPANRENPPPAIRYRPTDRRWDVFEPDGMYLGRVKAPSTFTPQVMRGNTVWGVVRDADGLPWVVRMRVEPALSR